MVRAGAGLRRGPCASSRRQSQRRKRALGRRTRGWERGRLARRASRCPPRPVGSDVDPSHPSLHPRLGAQPSFGPPPSGRGWQRHSCKAAVYLLWLGFGAWALLALSSNGPTHAFDQGARRSRPWDGLPRLPPRPPLLFSPGFPPGPASRPASSTSLGASHPRGVCSPPAPAAPGYLRLVRRLRDSAHVSGWFRTRTNRSKRAEGVRVVAARPVALDRARSVRHLKRDRTGEGERGEGSEEGRGVQGPSENPSLRAARATGAEATPRTGGGGRPGEEGGRGERGREKGAGGLRRGQGYATGPAGGGGRAG